MRARSYAAAFTWILVTDCGPREAAHGAAITVPLPPAPSASVQPSEPPKRDGDGDGDGVPDAEDFCPSALEDIDRCDDEDGCPEDDDHDGTPDASDECRYTVGPEKNKGCPLPAPPGTVVWSDSGDDCMILNPVPFPKGSAALSPEGEQFVRMIIDCMAVHKQILLLDVRGYASKGEAVDDLALRRAETVQRAMVAGGVEARRLRASRGDPKRMPHGDNLQTVQFLIDRTLSCPAAHDHLKTGSE